MPKQHGIRIPGTILDVLKNTDYENDERFASKKRKKGSTIGRKEKRKQQRLAKKQRHQRNDLPHSENLQSSFKKSNSEKRKRVKFVDDVVSEDDQKLNELQEDTSDNFEQVDSAAEDLTGDENFSEAEDNEMTVEETMEALKRAKSSKAAKTDDHTVSYQQSGSKDDEELSGDFSGEEEEEEEEEEMTVEETMAALKAAKEKKNGKGKKVQKIKSESKSKESSKKSHHSTPLTRSERAQIERDEMDMSYYAKKLGLKGKTKKLKASDEFDAVGGLLEGLDFFENYGEDDAYDGRNSIADASNSDEYDGTDEDNLSNEGSHRNGEESSHYDSSDDDVQKAFSSDDELSSGDFDEFDENDLNEEELEQLRELEGDDSDFSSGKKENPYVAPNMDTTEYIPPSLRRQQLSSNEPENLIELRKKIKSSLNKISESNISVIVAAINDLYESNPRQYVTDILSAQITEIICQKNKLLDSFILNYAALIVSMWKLRGIEVGASFTQYLVQKFLDLFEAQLSVLQDANAHGNTSEPVIIPKNCSNLITLLSYCYNLGLISCKLIYDMIALFIMTPNEFTTELLLRIISVSGPLIRGDDPKALKEILSDLLKNVKSVSLTPRLKFLLETMSDLKNNRLKPSVMATNHSSVKKTMSAFLKNSISSAIDPLQVTLDDIKSIESKGKWWLVGASWKGNLETAFDDRSSLNENSSKGVSKIVVEDNLLDDIPDWTVIAKQQRMNTDIRRAIFVSIMAAQDFMDAFAKIEKLNLKNKQSLEIPKVLIHCLSMEAKSNGYNPYYGLLAAKLCEQNHHLLKSFQFIFWDIIKKFENDHDSDSEDDLNEDETDEEQRLKKISNQGRFFGYLISQGVFNLNVFKHVPLMGGLNSDGMLFVEILLFQILLSVARKSETKSKKNSQKVYEYKDDHLRGLITSQIKLENKPVILKAFKWFTTKKFKYEKYVSSNAKSKEYEREKRRLLWAAPKFVELINQELAAISS